MEKEELFENWLNSLDIPLMGWQKEILRVACTQPDKKVYISMPRHNGRHLVLKLMEQFEQMIKGEKEMQKKLEKFDMKDIHSDYVVKFRNGKLALCMRVGEKFTKIFACLDTASKVCGAAEEKTFVYTSRYKANAYYRYSPYTNIMESYPDFDIVAVYGLIEGVKNYLDIAICDERYRPLLWEETKKMTLEDIEKALGYKVEIVKEEPPTKSAELCEKCKYSVDRMRCGKRHACRGCKMNLGEEVRDRVIGVGTTHCQCNIIAIGEPCPYFEEAK